MKKIFITLIFLGSFQLEAELYKDSTKLNFKNEMKNYCLENQYNCLDNGTVSGHTVNNLLYKFFLKVENFFYNEGFSKAEFEFCAYSFEECLIEGLNVKNSIYKITKKFPKKRYYFEAFGGKNQNEGVYFFKPLVNDEVINYCTVQPRAGNKLSKNALKLISKNADISLVEVRNRFYKKYSIFLVQYFPNIYAFDKSGALPKAECWLRSKSKALIFEMR